MSALLSQISPAAGLTYDAIAERAGLAEAYSRIAAEADAIGDRKAVAYGLRQAAVALASAADAAALLHSPSQGGSR